MIWWKMLLLPVFIILFTYSVTSEDLNEIKRFGWLRARQSYQYNHPPSVESDFSPVDYDKVIDRVSRRHNFMRVSLSENSTDGSQSENYVSIPENERSPETLKTTTDLLDIESTSEYPDIDTTIDQSGDQPQFLEGFLSTSINKNRRVNLPKYTNSYRPISAPVTVTYNDEPVHIVSDGIKSGISSHNTKTQHHNRRHNRQKTRVDGSDAPDTRTESKDNNTESSILHHISADRESDESRSTLKTEPGKPGLRRRIKYKSQQYSKHQPQVSKESDTKSEISVDLEATQIIRKASLTNEDSKSSVEENEGHRFSPKSPQGTRKYFNRLQKVGVGRQYEAETFLSSLDNETESTQTSNEQTSKTSLLKNIKQHNETEKYFIADNETISKTNSGAFSTSDVGHDKTSEFSTQTRKSTRNWLRKPQRNATNFDQDEKKIYVSTAMENSDIQTKKTEASENNETIRLSNIQSSNQNIINVTENISKNETDLTVKNEVTARKYLKVPNLSSTSPFNDSTTSQNVKTNTTQTGETKAKTGETKEESIVLSIETVKAGNVYESKPQFTIDGKNILTRNNNHSAYLSGTLSAAVKALDSNNSLMEKEIVADEPVEFIQSSITKLNGEFTTNTENTQVNKDTHNVAFTTSEIIDTKILTTTTESVNENNRESAPFLKLMPHIVATGRYPIPTASTISSNTTNMKEINTIAPSHEKSKSNGNQSRLRSGLRGRITYQNSKDDRTTNNNESENQNIKVERKQRRPSYKKPHIASSIDTKIIHEKFQKDADQMSNNLFQSIGESDILKGTALKNDEKITEVKTNGSFTQSSEYQNEVTARKYLPHISSTNPFSYSTTSHTMKTNITHTQIGETKEESTVSTNTDNSETVKAGIDYESNPQQRRNTNHSAYLSGTLSTTVKALDSEHSLVEKDNLSDEPAKFIQSSVTNGEFTTYTESAQLDKDPNNIALKNSQITDTEISTTTVSVNEHNGESTPFLKVRPQIATTGRYSISTASSISSKIANMEEINTTAPSQEIPKPNGNQSRLRSGLRGRVTYQSSKVDTTTDKIESDNHNIKVERKHRRPLYTKTHTASSIDSEIFHDSKFQKLTDQLSNDREALFQSGSKSDIRKGTALKKISQDKTNGSFTQSSEYQNVSFKTEKTGYFKDKEAFFRPQQNNTQISTITTESVSSQTAKTEIYTADIFSTPVNHFYTQSSSENIMMNETGNIQTPKFVNIGETTRTRNFSAASPNLKESYQDVQQITNRGRIVTNSNEIPIKTDEVKTITQNLTTDATLSGNQPEELNKEVNEVVKKPFILKQRPPITKTTISNNLRQEGLQSKGKHSTIISINTTEKTKTLVSIIEPKIRISERPIETSIFKLSRTEAETNNSEKNDDKAFKTTLSASSGSTLITKDVFVEKPVQYAVEADTQGKPQDDLTPDTENNSSSLNSDTSYSQTSRHHGYRNPVVPIIEFENRVFSHNGKFVYSYEGADGTRAFSNGQLKEVSKDHAGEAVQGGFSYTDKDGNDFSLSYTADENGYRPVGAHLPTPPPIPPAIARALAYLATKTTPETITEPTTKI